MASPVIHSIAPSHCIASWETLLYQLWLGGTPAPAVQTLRRVHREMSAKLRGTLVVIAADSEMPDDVARRELVQFTREIAAGMLRGGAVIEGTGFRASLARSVLSGLLFTARVSFRSSVFSTVREAAVWMAEEPGLKISAGDLEATIRELRHRHAQQAPR